MRAWVTAEFGEPGAVLQLVQLPTAVAQSDQVLVQVAAVAANFADTLMITGRYQVRPPVPFTPGFELAGYLLQPTPDGRLPAGARVMAQVPWGAFAEFVAVAPERIVAVPSGVSMLDAVTLPISYTTAHFALFERAHLQPGECVLIHAGGGALGQAAIQLAKTAGAIVIATGGSAQKLNAARAAGAAHVLNYREPDWPQQVATLHPRGVDVVLDSVGGSVTSSSLKLLAWGGRLLLVGFASGEIPAIPANQLLVRCASALGVYWSHDRDGQVLRTIRDKLAQLLQAGTIRPRVEATYSFEQVPQVLSDVYGGRTIGKAVINVSQPAELIAGLSM